MRPAVAQFPMTEPVNVTAALRWDDAAAAFQASDFLVRPVGMVRLPTAGTYRSRRPPRPPRTIRRAVHEAVVAAVRLAGDTIARNAATGALTDSGLPPTQAGAMMRSGAAEILRHVPRMRV